MNEVSFTWQVSPRRALAVMAIVVSLLTVASTVAIGLLAWFRWPEGSLGYESVKFFWLDTEHNLPTLYQAATLGVAAALMLAVARQSPGMARSDRARWRTLALVFAFMALDELLRIHETVGDTSSFHFGAAGLLLYAPVAVLLLAWWLPLLARLEGRLRRLLVVAAILYVGGAAGIESLSQWYAAGAGKATPLYAGLATLEEVCEMAGVGVLVYALLRHLGDLQASRASQDPTMLR